MKNEGDITDADMSSRLRDVGSKISKLEDNLLDSQSFVPDVRQRPLSVGRRMGTMEVLLGGLFLLAVFIIVLLLVWE